MKMFNKLRIRFRLFDRLYFVIILLNFVSCLASANEKDYGIYNDVTNIITHDQQSNLFDQASYNQSDHKFRPSDWSGLRAKRLNNDKLRKYKEYRYEPIEDDSTRSSKNNYQFKRRSDLDEDYYYSPGYYSSTSPYTAHHLIYPPAVQAPIISLPVSPAVLPTPSAYYRKYRPSASRNYYRIHPSSNTIRRRLATSGSNYETVPPYQTQNASPSTSTYYYGTGLASHQPPPITYPPQITYPQHFAYPNSHGPIAHPTEHETHESKEVHSLLPIVTVIGIGAFMIPLLTTFFTAMLSTNTNCCQRQKERSNDVSFDLRDTLYHQVREVWTQIENAINSEW